MPPDQTREQTVNRTPIYSHPLLPESPEGN